MSEHAALEQVDWNAALAWPYGRIRYERHALNNLRVRLVKYIHDRDVVVVEMLESIGVYPAGSHQTILSIYYEPEEAPARWGQSAKSGATTGRLVQPGRETDGLLVELIEITDAGTLQMKALSCVPGTPAGAILQVLPQQVAWDGKQSGTGRFLIPVEFRERAMHRLEDTLRRDAACFASRHEIAGGITQGYLGLMEAVRPHNSPERLRECLLDLARECLLGAACIEAGLIDW